MRRENEAYEKAGNEWRWKTHTSVTFRDNKWYRHSEMEGSYAIDFMQQFYNMSFPEAVTYLLNGESGQVIHGKMYGRPIKKMKEAEHTEQKFISEETDQIEQKAFRLPEKNENMRRVYAYLMKQRLIDREIISHFAREGTLYESKKHHNAVFVGVDKEGVPRHAHIKGTYSDGGNFRMNEENSDPAYGFGHIGTSNKVYVFEAPIDFLSFLTLYPLNWKQNSYIVLNGAAEHAMLQILRECPQINTVILCLDHDKAGIENNGRLAELAIKEKPTIQIQILQPVYKDWNEDLKYKHGLEPIMAREHPAIEECLAWGKELKKAADSIDEKFATMESLLHYFKGIHDELKNGQDWEHLEDAFDGYGLLLAGIAIKYIAKCGKELGKDIEVDQIIDHLCRRYYPHKDKGNLKTRLKNFQKVFDELIEVHQTKDLELPENKELFVKKCMGLSMECVKTHIFLHLELKVQKQERGMSIACNQ